MSTEYELITNTNASLTTIFHIGGALYGLDASLVQEVVRVGELTRVYDAPADVIGVRNLRGKIVTVIDMASHLGVGCIQRGPENRLILMDCDGDPYGFLVDSVSEAVMVNEAELVPVTGNLKTDFARRVRGLWRYNGEIVSMLETREIFSWQSTIDNPGSSIPIHR
jgi:purine-binding chemotaxis protein CheW